MLTTTMLGGNSSQESYPSFLRLMDSDPETAVRQFHAYAWGLLKQRPPAALRRLPAGDREDVISTTVLLCLKDDQRMLRAYADTGAPFSHWLLRVANLTAHAELARQRRIRARQVDDPEGGTLDQVIDGAPSIADRREARLSMELVLACIARLGVLCRMLLHGSGDGLKPRQLARLLGYPADRARSAADQLRDCRRKLRALLKIHRDDRRAGREWAAAATEWELLHGRLRMKLAREDAKR